MILSVLMQSQTQNIKIKVSKRISQGPSNGQRWNRCLPQVGREVSIFLCLLILSDYPTRNQLQRPPNTIIWQQYFITSMGNKGSKGNKENHDNQESQNASSEVYWSKPIPYDSQGFTLSFDVNSFDCRQVEEFYQEYGLVVFRNVLDQKEVEESVSDLWDIVEESSKGVSRNDRESWISRNMPAFLRIFGFVGDTPFFSGDQLWRNRSHLNVYRAFKTIYQISAGEKVEEPMLAMFDRGSLLRPSKSQPEWITEAIPHFDINPWKWTKTVPEENWRSGNLYNESFSYWLSEGCYVPKVKSFTKLQGVLGLSDTKGDTGGFEAVCGFHRHIQKWCRETKVNRHVGDCPELMENMQRINQRAGSIVIFSRQLPHGISPNKGEQKVRYAQYLRMAPESTLMLTEAERSERKKYVNEMLPGWLKESEDVLMKEIYMLE